MLLAIILFCAFFEQVHGLESPVDKAKPNILLILADDLGFSDLGAYGSEIKTPNIDALARDGVLFSNFYSTASCSPTRAMLMTGKDHHRVGFGQVVEMNTPSQMGTRGYAGTLDRDSLTLAEIPAEHGQTQMAIYTIPRNHKAYLTSFSGSMSKAIPSSAIVLEVVFRENGVKRVKQNIAIDTTGSTSFIKYLKMPLPIEEKTDIIVNAKEVSQNNSGVFSNFALILVDQSDKYTTNV